MRIDQRRILYAIAPRSCCSSSAASCGPASPALGSIEAVLTVASFVGLVAAGQTFVILIGGIDLSVPWTLNAAAILMMSSAASSNARAPLALAARRSAWARWSGCATASASRCSACRPW